MKNILSASIIPCVLFYSEGEFIAEFKSSLFDTKGYNFLSDSNFNFYRDLKAGWKRSPEGFATYTIYFNEYKSLSFWNAPCTSLIIPVSKTASFIFFLQ